ncbi:MAG: hypothetical protein R3284_04975 [Rubricoccaceae bacterium]|nr:hypothetical protein [Rubricoccaceae bacterium]
MPFPEFFLPPARCMTPQSKFILDMVAKAYVAIAIAYCVYIWTAGTLSGRASLRTAIAVIGFGLCTWLPERFTENPIAVPLLKIFGVVGTTVMVLVIHTQSTQ